MSKISFYRQVRRDGGIRTGIDVDGESVLGRFESGPEEVDPVLRWFVDVRCEGPRLPDTPEETRQWFLKNTPLFRHAFDALIAELRAGMDFNTWPLLWPVPKPPRGVKMVIACSVDRRLDGYQLAALLEDLSDHWEETVRGLPAVEPQFR